MSENEDPNDTDPITAVEDATFDFTMGDNASAIEKLTRVTQEHPQCFEAWHALTEVYFSQSDIELALKSAEKAYEINKDDVHINTSLSRIWVEKGDKQMAEHFGAQARMLGWKDQINEPED